MDFLLPYLRDYHAACFIMSNCSVVAVINAPIRPNAKIPDAVQITDYSKGPSIARALLTLTLY